MIEAVLFDMDGTLVDSEPFHERSLEEALNAFGAQMPQDGHAQLLGKSESEVIAFVRSLGVAVAYDDWRETRWKRYQQFANDIPLRHDMAPALERLRMRATPMALVTNSVRRMMNLNLRAAGLTGVFAVCVTRDDVERGKPAPDGYLLAARRLAVAPANCLVVEDSPTGARAGLAAGMTTIFAPQQSSLEREAPEGSFYCPPDGSAPALIEGMLMAGDRA